MARAAVIPQSPPKRATRGRAKATTTSKAVGKQVPKTAKATASKRNTRTASPTINPPVDSDSDGETDDELGVVASKGRGKTASSRGKAMASTTGRGRRAAAVEKESESDNDDDDELAQSDAPKKRAGRPRTKALPKEEGTGRKAETTTANPRPRGRPKGTAAKATTEAEILKENTRRNMALDSQDLSSSQQRPTEILITTNSSMMRGSAKTKKKVTFQDLSDSEDDGDFSEPAAPTLRRRRGTTVSKDQDGLAAKPARKAATTTSRGRKPAATKKGAVKPLSPKKATQVAKAISSYASSDGEDDELNGEKHEIKLVINSPQKHGPRNTGLGSPVRRINFTPSKPSKSIDENGEHNIPPPRAFDFGDSLFMSSPARRPTPSPFHYTLKETPKRGALTLRDRATPLAQPNFTPMQDSPLKTSPRKANIGTPGRGSLFRDDNGIPAQPNFTPAQNSPLKSSPKKGIFGASFSAQKQLPQSPTFKSSLLLTPAKKVGTPFKSSVVSVKSHIATGSRLQAEPESDDELSAGNNEDSPLRVRDSDETIELEPEEREADTISLYQYHEDVESSPAKDTVSQAMDEELDEYAESDHSDGPASEVAEHDPSDLERAMEELEREVSAEDAAQSDHETVELTEQVDEDITATNMEMLVDETGRGIEDEDWEAQDDEDLPAKEVHMVTQDKAEDHDTWESELEAEQEHAAEFKGHQERTSDTYELFNGLEDVFTEKSHSPEFRGDDNDMLGVEDDVGNPLPNGDEDLVDFAQEVHDEEDELSVRDGEPTLVAETVTDDTINLGPIQPYEIEEPEDTPFVSFLLCHYVPNLPCVEESVDDPVPGVNTEHTSPLPNEPVDGQGDLPSRLDQDRPSSGHNTPSDKVAEPQQSSLSNRGPRFTLLAEQLSQWKASRPKESEPRRPRRRGIFSLLGRRSDAQSTTDQIANTDLAEHVPLLPNPSGSQEQDTASAELAIHEDNDEQEPNENEDLESDQPARQPMSEIAHGEAPAILESIEDEATEDSQMKEPLPAEIAACPAIESAEEEKENETAHLPAPTTPVRSRPLQAQTFHTVSKVPLKPEGQVSPVKISRKRGRSLSISSPVRSSPRLQRFVLPPKENPVPESPPWKSRRIQEASIRKSLSNEVISKPVETQRIDRARTPSRQPSPSKTPRKQVPVHEQCLRGAVVYVDVHTTEGEDASGIFVELLQQMGARCIKNWSWNPQSSVSPVDGTDPKEGKVGVTHVVFKDGGIRTLEKVRQAAGLVKCVGVGWVLDCERENKWLDEVEYAVDCSIIPRGGAKRRKSMEPRALSNINGTLVKTDTSGPSSNRRRSQAVENFMRSTTPISTYDRSTPENTGKYEASHTEADQKFWQTPRTPAYAFNMDSIGMSPATPFYLSQRSKLVQQTCPPKQSRQGLFSTVASEDEPSKKLKAKLEAARRKSLAYNKPSIGSPLVE